MVTLDEHPGLPAPGIAMDTALETENLVEKALMQLRPDDRAVVVLKHFVSLTYDEIAAVLEVPVKTVKSRLFTARERMRHSLLAQKA
jgi:RNA polymerase sigma-70 factor (ECF subfamily)